MKNLKVESPPWKSSDKVKKSRRSESAGAKKDGGRTVPMSGAGRQKGDYRTAQFRVEDKITDAASYSLKLDVLHKIEHEALRTPPGLVPMLRVTIKGETFRVLREQDFLALQEAKVSP